MTTPRSWRTALVAGALAGSCTITACGDDHTAGPPDGADCTRGTLAAGIQVGGTFTLADCTVASELRNRPRLAQSWTLHAEKNIAYIVRLNPVGPTPELDLIANVRGPNDDPALISVALNEYHESGEDQADAPSAEMILPSDRDQDISIRIEADDSAQGGSYTLEVVTCAITPLALGETSDSLEITGNCRLVGYPFSATPVSIVVLGFKVMDPGTYSVRADRNSGNASIRGLLGGAGLDVSDAHIGTSVLELLGSGTTIQKDRQLTVPGWYTFLVGIPTGTTANFTAKAGFVVPPAPTPERR